MKNEASQWSRRSKTHRLGQHRLIDKKVLSRIISESGISTRETVCEVGAGSGVLTEELCKVARSVISFEVDPTQFRETSQAVGPKYSNLNLINQDAFRTPPPAFDVFVSNLPYSRSRDAIEWLAQARDCTRAIVMLQDEFAEKLLAEPGSGSYRSVSVISRYCFSLERLFGVPRAAFKPEPKVRSVVLRLTRHGVLSEEMVSAINRLFSFKNKQVSAVLRRFGVQAGSLDTPAARVYQLDPQEIIELAGRVCGLK